MNHQDLINYDVRVEEPLWSSYKGYDLALPVPPSAGGIGIAMQLKILAQLDISQYEPHSAEKYHLMLQALQIAMADDAEHIEDTNTQKETLDGLLNEDYIRESMEHLSADRNEEEKTTVNSWQYQQEGGNEREDNVSADNERHETGHYSSVN